MLLSTTLHIASESIRKSWSSIPPTFNVTESSGLPCDKKPKINTWSLDGSLLCLPSATMVLVLAEALRKLLVCANQLFPSIPLLHFVLKCPFLPQPLHFLSLADILVNFWHGSYNHLHDTPLPVAKGEASFYYLSALMQ